MTGQLIRVSGLSGFTTLLFKFENGKYGRTYTGDKYRNYSIWSQFKIGDSISGLEWKDEKKLIINGDSPAHLV